MPEKMPSTAEPPLIRHPSVHFLYLFIYLMNKPPSQDCREKDWIQYKTGVSDFYQQRAGVAASFLSNQFNQQIEFRCFVSVAAALVFYR